MNFTNEEWDQKLKEVPFQRIDPKKWPKGIRPLSLDEEGLGIDREGLLYWNGKPVLIRRKFELRWIELTLAAIATLATVVQAIAAVAPFIR
jgi:hypothetical protein